MPAPRLSSKALDRSKTATSQPIFRRTSAAVRPPMDPPITTTRGGLAFSIDTTQSQSVSLATHNNKTIFFVIINLYPLATYVGWLLHKTWGGIVAGAFFVIPSIFILWTLSYIYVAFGNLPWIAAIFYGLKPAVLAIVAAAVIRIGSRALKNEVMWTLAAAAFIAIFFFHVPFPLIIISAALIGFFGGKWKRYKFLVIRGHGKAKNDSVLDDSSAVPDHAKPSWPRALRVALIWVILWSAPVLLLSFWLGSNHTVVKEGIFFSKAALVTFGGAYAVLPYVAQQAVQTHRWLSAG